MTDEERLKLQQYQPVQPKVDLGVKPVQAAPTPQSQLADQMAALITNMQQSPAGGTVTVNQPAPNTALDAVQAMQGGATAGQAIASPGRVPPRTTTAPVNTLDMNIQPDQNAPKPADDFGTTLAKMLTTDTGGGLKGAVEAMRSPQDIAARYKTEQDIANQQAMGQAAAADVANNARVASQRVAQEFPGQNPAMFPTGLSKLLPSGETFKAMPSGGYAVSGTRAQQDALVEQRRKAFAAANPKYKVVKPRRQVGEELFRTYG